MSATIEERLAAVMLEEAKADAAAKLEEQERTLAYYETKQRLASTLGKYGRDFLLLSTVEGLCAVKRVDAIHVKQYDDACAKARAEGKAIGTGTLFAFAAPGVVEPDAATFRKWVMGDPTGADKRPGADGIAALCANAIQRLHGVLEVEVHGKT